VPCTCGCIDRSWTSRAGERRTDSVPRVAARPCRSISSRRRDNYDGQRGGAASPGLPAAATGLINFTPGAATKLAISEPVGSVTAGSAFDLEFSAEDLYGNLHTNFDSFLTFQLTDGLGDSLSGYINFVGGWRI
jgi:hypothetical protein